MKEFEYFSHCYLTHAQELNEKPDNVTLSNMYPRSELDPELDSQNMVQLQLAPSAVILVRVKKVRNYLTELSRYYCVSVQP